MKEPPGRQTNLLFLRKVELENTLALGKLKGVPRGISLFSGAGGFDLGFLQAGMHSAVMVEWDKDCCWTLRANLTRAGIEERWERDKGMTDYCSFREGQYPDFMEKRIKDGTWEEPVIIQKDICQVSTEEILKAGKFEIGEPAFVIGGPPCQGFSYAGKRMIDDPRNRLYKEFVRVVGEAYPRFVAFENVPGLASMNKGRIMRQVAEDFACCGYTVNWQILNAANYGVPQIRRRIFLIANRNDVMVIPEEGNPQIHFGGSSGPVFHPDWFLKKYSKEWAKTCDKCRVEEIPHRQFNGLGDPYPDE